MVTMNAILARYLAFEFVKKLGLVAALLVSIVYLFEIIDLFGRVDDKDNVPLGAIFQMGFYKLPEVVHEILPFIVFFASIVTLRALSDTAELVILRTSGLSVWQFLMPLLTVTVFVSLVYIAVLHPLFAGMMTRYEKMQNFYFGDGTETIARIDDGLWLRQEDRTGNFILKASALDAREWVMDNIVVFFFDENNIHTQRIDAGSAILSEGEWDFKNVSVHQTDGVNNALPSLKLTTTLTPQTIEESFTSPQTISFWRLPFFIAALEPTGLDTMELRSYYQSLLVQPLLFVAMMFLAAVLTLKTGRFVKMFPLITMGLIATVAVFFASSFLKTLALGEEIPMILAMWVTPILILLISIYFLSYREDG